MLNKAFLTGKVSWNIATQPLSYITLTPTEAGYINSAKAMLKMMSKGIRNTARKDSVSLRIKTGDILSDAVGEGREASHNIYRSPIDKWNDAISVISSAEERLLHQTSYVAGLDKAKELGYKGEDAKMFADLVAERSQSMYNKESRALILNSDITTAAIPFQSFAVEMANHVKEIFTKSGGVNLKVRERFGKLIRLATGIWLGNQYAQAITGRKKTSVGTFIPFAGPTVDMLIAKATDNTYQSSRSPVSFVQQANDIIRASKDYLDKGSTKRLRKLGITFIPAMFGIGGGGQISNLVDGIIADINEEVTNIKGKKLFDVKDTISKIKAPIFGPWATKGGRDYWNRGNTPEAKEIKKAIKLQTKGKEELNGQAEDILDSFKDIGIEDKISYMKDLKKENEPLHKLVMSKAKLERLNLQYTDNLMKRLQVKNGARAKFINNKLNELKNPEAQMSYSEYLISKGILTKEVRKQITEIRKGERNE